MVLWKNSRSLPRQDANQTVRLAIGTKDGDSSIRISFTDQRLSAHGGMVVRSHHLKERAIREQLRQILPHAAKSPNSYRPTDIALAAWEALFVKADKLSWVA